MYMCLIIYSKSELIMFEYKTNEDQQNKIYARYLEFCNLRLVYMKRIKFSYNYKKNTMRVEAKNHHKRIEFNIDDFVDWDRANYPNNPCLS
jgi:hypothetical protein